MRLATGTFSVTIVDAQALLTSKTSLQMELKKTQSVCATDCTGWDSCQCRSGIINQVQSAGPLAGLRRLAS
jgi:hypothetical protein